MEGSIHFRLGYDEDMDYRQLMILAYENEPKYRKCWMFTKGDPYETFAEELEAIYQSLPDDELRDRRMNAYCHTRILWYQQSKNRQDKYNEDMNRVLEASGLKPIKVIRSYMVTLNFNPNNTSWKNLPLLGLKVTSQKWCEKAVYCYEFHGHPHIHMVLHLNEAFAKSKLIEKLYRVAGMKSHISGKEKIDVREYEAVKHDKYLIGSKKEAKLESCEEDYAFREEVGLPHIIEYSK